MKSDKTLSCGCLNRELASERATTHAKSKTCEYKIYRGIVNRCTNPNVSSYVSYGERGIKIIFTFEEFFDHLGLRPSKFHTVDRIDNDGDYCIGNIRWVLKGQQSANRRKKNKTGYKGVFKTKEGRFTAKLIHLSVRYELGRFDDPVDAADAWDRKCYDIYKDKSILNFPEKIND